jgi:hypothetical protein
MHQALAAMRRQWGESFPFLRDETFDSLADDFVLEDWWERWAAFGQEISAHGATLWWIDDDAEGEDLCLALVPADQQSGFKAWVKAGRHSAQEWRQSRRKTGLPAKRVNPSERIEIRDIAELGRYHWHVTFPGPATGFVSRRHFSKGAYVGDSQWCFDSSVWPPALRPLTKLVRHCSVEKGRWAVLYSTGKRINDRPVELWVQDRLQNPEQGWRILFPERPGRKLGEEDTESYYSGDMLRPSIKFCWKGEDLLLGDAFRAKPGSCEERMHVWIARKAARGETTCEKIFVSEPYLFSYILFFEEARTGAGEQFFRIGSRLYTLEPRGFFLKRETLQDAGMEVEPWAQFPTVPSGEHSFVYQCNGRLVEQNVRTKKRRVRDLPGISARSTLTLMGDNLVVAHPWSIDYAKENSALFWDMEKDVWLRLPFASSGCLVEEIHALSETDWILVSQGELRKVHELLGQLRHKRKYRLDAPAWVEEESEINELLGRAGPW